MRINFDIALSFAGEDREIARELAETWSTTYGLKIFYDRDEQSTLVGEDLIEYLHEVYSESSLYCAVIISRHYREKRWTRHEIRAAQERAFNDFDTAYILPIRTDDTKLPGFPVTRGFLDTREVSIQEIADILYRKVKDRVEIQNAVREAEKHFNAGDFERAVTTLENVDVTDSYDGLVMKADALHRLFRYKESIAAYEKAIKIRGDEFLPYFLLGVSCFRDQQFEKAVKYYARAHELNPTHLTVIQDGYLAELWHRRMSNPLTRWYYARQLRKGKAVLERISEEEASRKRHS